MCIKVKVNAYKVSRVPGDMRVIHWRQLTKKWKHLRHRPFPSIDLRPVVDISIGIDNAELHCALEEIKGDPRDPIA